MDRSVSGGDCDVCVDCVMLVIWREGSASDCVWVLWLQAMEDSVCVAPQSRRAHHQCVLTTMSVSSASSSSIFSACKDKKKYINYDIIILFLYLHTNNRESKILFEYSFFSHLFMEATVIGLIIRGRLFNEGKPLCVFVGGVSVAGPVLMAAVIILIIATVIAGGTAFVMLTAVIESLEKEWSIRVIFMQ